MRITRKTFGMLLAGSLAGAGGILVAQTAMKPGHDRVPPHREPSPYMSAADIQAALSRLDPKLVASRTGGSIQFAPGKAGGSRLGSGVCAMLHSIFLATGKWLNAS